MRPFALFCYPPGVAVTLYRLYAANGNRAGFWVQHRTWTDSCAQVQSIDGRKEGALPGDAHAYDAADVMMRVFDVRSGRPIPSEISFHPPTDKNYTQIAEPYWH